MAKKGVRKTDIMKEQNKQQNDIQEYRKKYNEYMVRMNWSKSTYRTYNLGLDHFFRFIQTQRNKQKISEISNKDIASYQNYLYYYRDEKNKPSALKTQMQKLIIINSFFKFLQKKNMIMINPAKSIEFPKEERKLSRRPYKEKEIKKMFEQIDHSTISGYRDRVVIEILYATGIRASEVSNIKLEHLNFEENTIFIENGKGGKDRIVPFAEITKKYIQEYIIYVRPKLLRKRTSPYLILSWRGKRLIAGTTITDIVQHYSEKAKIKGWLGAHNFRVTTATSMLINGAEERYIQEILGHSDLRSVEYYLKIEISELKKEHKRTHPREAGN